VDVVPDGGVHGTGVLSDHADTSLPEGDQNSIGNGSARQGQDDLIKSKKELLEVSL
jgi:hypothetical protein